MPLTLDWLSLQAAITEYSETAEEANRNVVVLSLAVSGSTARASTAVAASLLRGLVNDYFETYDVPVRAEFVHITNTGISQGPTGYSLAVYLYAAAAKSFSTYANEIRTAIEQALEDLPKNLDRPDGETTQIIEALRGAELLGDDDTDA